MAEITQTISTVTSLPTPPNPNNPATFDDLAYTYTVAQNAFGVDVNDMATELNTFATQTNALRDEVVQAKEAVLTNYKGIWNSGTTYAVGESVSSGGFYWISNVNSNLNNTPIEGANWSKVGTVGGSYLSISGGTMTGALLYDDVNKGTVSSGTVTFTQSSGNVQKLTVGGSLTIALNGWGASGVFCDLLLNLVNAGSATVTLPTINWIKPDGTKTTTFSEYLTAISRPALQSSGVDFMYLFSIDAGSTVYGKLL